MYIVDDYSDGSITIYQEVMVIYFDLDDTLYRLYDPFYKAYQKVFHEDLDIYALWKQSRIYSNEI